MRERRYDESGRPLCFVCQKPQADHPGGRECQAPGPVSEFGELHMSDALVIDRLRSDIARLQHLDYENAGLQAEVERLLTYADGETDKLRVAYADIAAFEDAISQLRGDAQHLLDVLDEIAGDYGCQLREPPDVSQPPRDVEACRHQWPAEPERWCVCCMARSAVDGSRFR
jgi:hypothetical protein